LPERPQEFEKRWESGFVSTQFALSGPLFVGLIADSFRLRSIVTTGQAAKMVSAENLRWRIKIGK